MSIDIEELLETFPEEARQAWRDKTNWKEADHDLLPNEMCPKYPWQDTDHDDDKEDGFGWRIAIIRRRWAIKEGKLFLQVWHLECYDHQGYDCQSFLEAEELPQKLFPADFDDIDKLYETANEGVNLRWNNYFQWVERNQVNPLEAQLPKENQDQLGAKSWPKSLALALTALSGAIAHLRDSLDQAAYRLWKIYIEMEVSTATKPTILTKEARR